MNRLSVALVIVESNDFQLAQETSAQEAAQRLGVDLRVIKIEEDAIQQSQQILRLVQSTDDTRPNGILFEPVGTALAQPARLAASKGIGWGVLNRETVDYVKELRSSFPQTPIFTITTSHGEVGRIQGEQISRLLHNGGTMLYIQGPAGNEAAIERTAGMLATKPSSVEVRSVKGHWSEQSAVNAVTSWLKLSTNRETDIRLVAAQNDAMALGARRAFELIGTVNVPFLGCDGLPGTGQSAVRRKLLTATVVIPPNAGAAVEAMVRGLKTGQQVNETMFTAPTSFPGLESLRP
jgi:ABC-type sugar transport system substrate-binding protein